MSARPTDESRRLAALHSYGLLDSNPETVFDHLTQFAAEICETPIALISLVDTTRQWFKSKYGLEAISETPRDLSFCSHTIEQQEMMLVTDTTADARFSEHPMVVGAPNFRFYAGMPLTTPDGHNLGTLCVIDHHKRDLSSTQRQALERLALLVVDLFEFRSRRSTSNSDYLLELLDGTNDELFLFDTRSLRMTFANGTARRNLGYDRVSLLGLRPEQLFPQLNETSLRNLLAPLNTGVRSDVILDTVEAAHDGTKYPVRVRFVLAEAGSFKAYLAFSTNIGEPIPLPEQPPNAHAITDDATRQPRVSVVLPGDLSDPSDLPEPIDKTPTEQPTSDTNTRVELIIQTAQAVLVEEGYAGFSLRKVAKRAGISVGNLQYHFPAKGPLISGIMDALLGRWMGHYERHIEVIANPRDRLAECASYLLSDETQQGMFHLLREMWALSVHDEDAATSVAEFSQAWQTMQATIIRGVNPNIEPDRANTLAAIAVAMLSGAFVGLSNPSTTDSEELRKEMIHNLMQLSELN